MLLLPKKNDLDKARNNETKRQIDDGIALAKRVDELRRMRLDLEKNFETWRIETSKTIQLDIDNLIKEKEEIKKEIIVAYNTRTELLKPLDKEWEKVVEEKDLIYKDKNQLFLDKELFKVEANTLEKEKVKISDILEKTRQSEKDIDKIKSKTQNLKDMAQGEYEKALEEREQQNNRIDYQNLKLSEKIKEYEVALKTIEISEQQVKDKEENLLEREKSLKDRYETLERTIKRLNL